jgi:hypothetical protein
VQIGITEINFGSYGQNIAVDETFFNNSNVAITTCGTLGLYGLAYAAFNTGNGIQLRIFNYGSFTYNNVPARMQNPIGNDVAGRIIRIRDNGPGSAAVEVDQTIPPGATNVTAQQGKNYIELEVYGNIVNGNPPYTGWGIREMQG